MEFNIKRSKKESNTSECYTSLVLLFQQVSVMAHEKVGGWELIESATYNDEGYFLTVYSNGKFVVKAESSDGDHVYSTHPIKEIEK